MTEPDAPEPLDTSTPFRTGSAIAAGITRKELRGPRFRSVWRGIHVASDTTVTPKQRIEAALMLFDVHASGVRVSHHSAAVLLGVPVPHRDDVHLTVSTPKARRRRPGLCCHVDAKGRVIERDGVRVSAPRQLFVELAAQLSLVDLVVAGDYLVRHELTTPEALVAYCDETHLPHAKEAMRAARLVRPRVDSPMETRLRLLLVLAGFPEPEVNLELRTADGEVVRRHDLSYPAVKVVIEYDGRPHVEREARWEKDLRRRELSESEGWRFLVVISKDVFRTPGDTLDRIWRVLRDRGLPGLPDRFGPEWTIHFPGY